MILTYKIKHNKNFSIELEKAKKVAEFAIQNRDKLSTRYISYVGLNSVIANQILRKYGKNKKCKKINKIKLIVPNQGIKYRDSQISIYSLTLVLPFNKVCEKVNCIELDNEYAYVSVTIKENKQIIPEKHIGIDLNTTGHCAVVAVKETGKVYKLGKKTEHIHKKYKNIRKSLQKLGRYKTVKKIKNRESRIIKDLNHKISRFIVNLAVREKGGIQLEKLQDIRKTKEMIKSFKYALNSWSYYQLGQFLEYKALLAGIPLTYINPAYTSKTCSRCGLLGYRNDKYFKCSNGHVEHADSNAAFNIAELSQSIVQLQKERDFCKRSTDTRQEATQESYVTSEPHTI